jgi:cytochrome b pre-mRNA-processing protein 6
MAYRHQLRALSRWPKDPLRPEIQFQDVIRRRIDRRLGISKAEDTKGQLSNQNAKATWNEKEELEQANVLYALLGNRFSQKV